MSEQAGSDTGFAVVGEARLAYEIAGAGPPLLLLHAGVADRRMWDAQFAIFATRFRTIRYDLRGYGASTLPPEPVAHHEDVRGPLDALGIARAHLVGLSLGGTTALDAALVFPERVAGLVIVGASPSGAPVSAAVRAGWQAVDALLERGDVAGAIELELRMWVDGPARPPDAADPAVRAQVRAMEDVAVARVLTEPEVTVRRLEPPAYTRLGEVRSPALVIAGDLDYPEKLAHARLMAVTIPHARLEIIPGVAHMVNMEAPERFTRIVLEFLTGLA